MHVLNKIMLDKISKYKYIKNIRSGAVGTVVSASRLHREGPGFESLTAHHSYYGQVAERPKALGC